MVGKTTRFIYPCPIILYLGFTDAHFVTGAIKEFHDDRTIHHLLEALQS